MATTINSKLFKVSSNYNGLLNADLGNSDQKDTSLSAQNKKINRPRIAFFEDGLAALEGGVSALTIKSVKSGTYQLVKSLLKPGDNIVTVNSSALVKNEAITNRLGLEVRLAEDAKIDAFKSIVDENTKLIFIESVSYETNIVPDFQKIISYAKARKIPVAVDNTIGFAGNIINPIKLGANFVLESTKNWLDFNNDSIGAVLVDAGTYNWENGIFPQFQEPNLSFYNFNSKKLVEKALIPGNFSLINFIKSKGNIGFNKYEVPGNSLNLVHQLEEVKSKTKKLSYSALRVAKWLKEKTYVNNVDYVGLPSHESYFNALRYFSDGFGNQITFSLWTNNRAFDFFLDNLLPKSFKLFKLTGISYESKKITFTVLDTEFDQIIEHFQHTFDLLKGHLGSDYFLYEDHFDLQDLVGY